MKTYATYGLVGAAIGALMTLALFFLGWHGEQIAMTAKWYVWLPMLLIGTGGSATILALGMRTVREEAPGQGLSYGRGLVVGILISLWQGLAGAIFQVLYLTVINPSFGETMIEFQVQKMHDQGAPSQAIEMARKIAGFTTSVPFQAVMHVLGTVLFGLIISLVVSAIVKREPRTAEAPPPIAG